MCEAARDNGRGNEIQEAFPRPRLLLEAVLLSDGCFEGLLETRLFINDYDYKTTHAELTARMNSIEAKFEREIKKGDHVICAIVKRRLRPLEIAVMRLDEWREASICT